MRLSIVGVLGVALGACDSGGDDDGAAGGGFGEGGGGAAGAAGSGGSADDELVAELRCREALSAGCVVLADCHAVTPSGRAIGLADCGAIVDEATPACAEEGGSGLASLPDAEFDRCYDALIAQPCDEICGRVPVLPGACLGVLEPSSRRVSCE